MKFIPCKHCGRKFELDDSLTSCPYCHQEIENQVADLEQDAFEDSQLETIVHQPDQDSDLEEISPELATLNTNPLATLEAPQATRDDFSIQVAPPDSTQTASVDGPNQTLGRSEATVGDQLALHDGLDFDTGDPGPLDPTLVTPKQEPEGTVINPDAAREAAAKYSIGLKTVIPPRTISREDQPGQHQDYKVEKRLGSGAFGVVFRAVQVPLDRSVAVKVLQGSEDESEARNLQLKNEFLREAQFTGRLEHPNIVPIHDIGLTVNPNGKVNPFYAMKEIRGESWLDTIRTKTPAENLTVLKHVVNAIGFAHAHNILHCDLKPANVMLGEYGEVLVVDWGQAIDLAQPETIRPGGTPAYISPEMAKYWCDRHLDKKSESPARALVGHRSDVYLLGSLLFEIVTENPPHGGPNDSPYEVIRQAAENEIVAYDEFINDELLQIALAALRVSDRESIETVDALMSAIVNYENRRLSIELRQRASEVLAIAKQNSDYDEFQRARFGFEESLEKWQDNESAKIGLSDARLSCAELALHDQNFDLGIGMLDDAQTLEETVVKEQLVSGKNKRDRRKKLVRWLALGLASSIIVGIGMNSFMISENYKSAKLRDLAVAEKQKVEQEVAPLRQEVKTNKKQIELNEQEIAQFPLKFKQEQNKFKNQLVAEKQNFETQLTTEQANLATRLKQEQDALDRQLVQEQEKYSAELKTEQQRLAIKLKSEQQKFESEKQKFESEKMQLVEQKDELNSQVASLNESSRFLRYKNRLTNVRQKLQTGNYREARRLLETFENRNDWEVARLNLLSHPEVDSIYPDKPLTAFAASADGSRFALAFADQIEIRDTNQFNRAVVAIPIDAATAVALSADGKKLAIGKPSDSLLKPGTIWIVDLSQPNAPSQDRTLAAQSRAISSLSFSNDSSRFLSVGTPSMIRKSSRDSQSENGPASVEEELMVWDDDWNRVDVALIVERGAKPEFSRAEFSADGQRILTTNAKGISRDQLAHVFAQRGESYKWIATSPSDGINVASFASADGASVVGCVRENQTGTFSLAAWNLRPNEPTEPGEFISTTGGKTNRSFRTIAQLDQKALSIWRTDSWIVTAGEDKQVTLWDWKTKTPTQFGGHSRDVDYGALIPGSAFNENVLISVSAGANPEILKTDLSTYQNEDETRAMGRVAQSDQPSPSSFFRSIKTPQTTVGNDLGQVSVERTINGEQQKIQWNVSAWKNHFLCDGFLYAQSRGDLFYKFNRATGALESVLTQLASAEGTDQGNNIIKFEVSDDGKTALVVTADRAPEFHVWNLETETKIRTIDYGKENIFGTGSEKELLALKLSPDGQWVIAGKVGVFAWSTRTGERKQLTQPGTDMARNPVSSIVFLDPGSKFLVSWKDRIDLFDLNRSQPAKRFNPRNISYSKNEPNLFGAQARNGQVLVLARSAGSSTNDSGVALIDLESNTTIKQFPLAKFASFGNLNSGEVLVVNKPGATSAVEKWEPARQQMSPIQVGNAFSGELGNRFRSIDRVFEDATGNLTMQASTRNKRNSLEREWSSVSISPDGSLGQLRVIAKPEIEFAATANDRAITLDSGTVRFWKLLNGSVQPDGILEGDYGICRLSPDEQTLLAVSGSTNQVIGIDPATRQTRFTVEPAGLSPISSIQWHPDSTQFAIGRQSGDVELWRAGDQTNESELSSRFTTSDQPISDIQFAQDANTILIITKSDDKALVVHRQNGGQTTITIQQVDGQKIVVGDISADGKRIVTGTDKGRLTIWNCETSSDSTNELTDQQSAERELMNLPSKHQSPIQFVRFLPGEAGQTEIVSGASKDGENKYLIWKTLRP